MTGPSTRETAEHRLIEVNDSTTARNQVRLRKSAQPARKSAIQCSRSGLGALSILSRDSSSALSAKVTASATIAQPGPAVTTRAPATAGPTRPDAAIVVCSTALARCSSSAGTSAGVSPFAAGVNIAVAALATAVRHARSSTGGCPVTSVRPSASWDRPRPMSAAIITTCLGTRSATTPPASMNTTSARAPLPSTRPRSLAEPVRSSTANDSATGTSMVPSHEMACAANTSRKLRSRKTSIRAPPSAAYGADHHPWCCLQHHGRLDGLGEQDTGRVLPAFRYQGRPAVQDRVVDGDLRTHRVGQGPLDDASEAGRGEVRGVIQVHWLPGGEDDQGTGRKDPGDLPERRRLVLDHPQRVDADGPVECARWQVRIGSAGDAEFGHLGHAKGCGVLAGGSHCLRDDVDPDQRGTELAGNPQTRAATSAAPVKQPRHGRSGENVSHRTQLAQRYEPERIGFGGVFIAVGLHEYRLERRASRQPRQH